jgi:uracil-DNA glycosylase family 4
LAPGAHGSNRTGRVFTGDSSGETLFGSMYRTGFANQPEGYARGDGLQFHNAFITAVGRCAPPKNKPTAAELDTCQPYLHRELALLTETRVILALGQIAFKGCLRLLNDFGYNVPRLKFSHGFHYQVNQINNEEGGTRPLHLLACYHPSRQNTQTGRLTLPMIDAIFEQARTLCAAE